MLCFAGIIKKSIKEILHPSKLRGETVRVILKSQLVNNEYQKTFELLADYTSFFSKGKLLFSRKPQGMTQKEFCDFKVKILFNSY